MVEESSQQSAAIVISVTTNRLGGVQIAWQIPGAELVGRIVEGDSLCASEVTVGFPLPASCSKVNIYPAD
ncbi:MAG: hypothetical protein IH960_10465 [Chloroflexi bacterium]|nr:hypothetical protein [Chloroflexota bacterium]